jgi:hypothetical protein
MSRYENTLKAGLTRIFLHEARETLLFIESQNPLLLSFKSIALSALKMQFVWLLESLKGFRNEFSFPEEFNYLAMKEVRNRIVHQPRRWSDESEVLEIRHFVDVLARILTNPNR